MRSARPGSGPKPDSGEEGTTFPITENPANNEAVLLPEFFHQKKSRSRRSCRTDEFGIRAWRSSNQPGVFGLWIGPSAKSKTKPLRWVRVGLMDATRSDLQFQALWTLTCLHPRSTRLGSKQLSRSITKTRRIRFRTKEIARTIILSSIGPRLSRL
jgi:hypothetical protein